MCVYVCACVRVLRLGTQEVIVHGGPVTRMALSHDESTLITVGADGSLCISTTTKDGGPLVPVSSREIAVQPLDEILVRCVRARMGAGAVGIVIAAQPVGPGGEVAADDGAAREGGAAEDEQ